jgi:hypothetical protein
MMRSRGSFEVCGCAHFDDCDLSNPWQDRITQGCVLKPSALVRDAMHCSACILHAPTTGGDLPKCYDAFYLSVFFLWFS